MHRYGIKEDIRKLLGCTAPGRNGILDLKKRTLSMAPISKKARCTCYGKRGFVHDIYTLPINEEQHFQIWTAMSVNIQ